MSIDVMNWVFKHSPATGNDRLILLAIADEANDDGGDAHPSVDRIAAKARVNKRTCLRCIERLEADGGLLVSRPEVRGRGHYNEYVVVMRSGDTFTPDEASPTEPEKARNGDTGNREKARIGADPRLNGSRPIDPVFIDPQTQETLLPDDDESSSKPPQSGSDDDPLFAAFWEAYPKRVKKGAARKAWRAVVREHPAQINDVIEGARRYARDPNLPPAQYIPYPSSWLTGERWNDGPEPSATGRDNGKPKSSIRMPIIDDRTPGTGPLTEEQLYEQR